MCILPVPKGKGDICNNVYDMLPAKREKSNTGTKPTYTLAIFIIHMEDYSQQGSGARDKGVGAGDEGVGANRACQLTQDEEEQRYDHQIKKI